MASQTSNSQPSRESHSQGVPPIRKDKGSRRLDELRESLKSRCFFDDDKEALRILKRAFSQELDYLQTSYATSSPGSDLTHTPSPSQQLFDSPGYHEINRTLTGVLALIWIFRNDYHAFTHNQTAASRLDQRSFDELRAYYANCLEDFNNIDALLALIVMQMTNDLGKSKSLGNKLMRELPSDINVSKNHDMIMYQVIKYAPELIPCFKALGSEWKHTVCKLVRLSATFNPGQFVQGECQPVALEALQEDITAKELDMKFMEMFLDLSGASGHRSHEGAASMTEAAFQGYMRAKTMSHEIIAQRIDTQGAYMKMLEWRLDVCRSEVGEPILTINSDRDYAIARLLCMGRVTEYSTATEFCSAYEQMEYSDRLVLTRSLNCYQAELYSDQAWQEYGAEGIVCFRGVQTTYAPGMLALIKGPNLEDKLCAFFTYLSHVSTVSMSQLAEDMNVTDAKLLPNDIKIVERDIRCLDSILSVEDGEFNRDPRSALQRVGIPPAQISVPIF